jgi:vacuolar-type H+-ATPase subunit I/STV1
MKVEVSNGELMDKLSILELKLKNIADSKKLINIKTEVNELNPLVQKLFKKYNPAVNKLYTKLAEINGKLWIIEDEIRQCEKDKNFGTKFVKLARDVYFTNDVRSDLKKEINILTNSGVIEEKSYEDYS